MKAQKGNNKNIAFKIIYCWPSFSNCLGGWLCSRSLLDDDFVSK
jgi:hypothetical protein